MVPVGIDPAGVKEPEHPPRRGYKKFNSHSTDFNLLNKNIKKLKMHIFLTLAIEQHLDLQLLKQFLQSHQDLLLL